MLLFMKGTAAELIPTKEFCLYLQSRAEPQPKFRSSVPNCAAATCAFPVDAFEKILLAQDLKK